MTIYNIWLEKNMQHLQYVKGYSLPRSSVYFTGHLIYCMDSTKKVRHWWRINKSYLLFQIFFFNFKIVVAALITVRTGLIRLNALQRDYYLRVMSNGYINSTLFNINDIHTYVSKHIYWDYYIAYELCMLLNKIK